jgi:CRISPR-associated protein Cst2
MGNNIKKNINCVSITSIIKTSIGSINGSFTEGNISTIKKITTPEGLYIPYISGQSLRHSLRESISDSDYSLSEIKKTTAIRGVDHTDGDPINFIDDDIFGYMIAETNNNRRRTAPIRVSPAVGLFPYMGDRDLGTKSKEGVEGQELGGNMFETEIYNNFFRTTILLELDRIGVFKKIELGKDKNKTENVILDQEERTKRINTFLNALLRIWGGGKQSRFLTDLTPKLLISTVQTAKVPIFLESLQISKDCEIHTNQILEVLNDYQNIIESIFIGIRSGIFSNEQEVISELQSQNINGKKISVGPINMFIENIMSLLKEFTF